MNIPDYSTLKERHRSIRDHCDENLNLRVHRALSWLQRAELCDDDDGRFIFLWIAFNAAYAYEWEGHRREAEVNSIYRFFEKICGLDQKKVIDELIWREFSGSIRVLLQNQYVFQPFWDFHAGKIDEEMWISRFKSAKTSANIALANHATVALLDIVFNRLYTLRNQLIHGGATWNSGVNRTQVRDSTAFLGKFLPVMLELMMDGGESVWGSAVYPVVA